MRAEHGDFIEITHVDENMEGEDIPSIFKVIQRDVTYFGPKLRVGSGSEKNQYILTAPGPESQAKLWQTCKKGWKEMGEVSLDFKGEPPKYDVCLHCNEPISNTEHRRLSLIGACDDN